MSILFFCFSKVKRTGVFFLSLYFSISTIFLGCSKTIHLENYKFVEKLEDKSIVVGKTVNGTTFYIKDHDHNENKIKVALIVDAGSVLERNDQLGLAHFVEHMGFNGTKKFPGNEIIKILQNEGVRLMGDLNAFTGYEATAFYISIPENKPHLLSLSIDILEEWLHNMTYSEEEIEKEKGVVLEEVRAAEQPFKKAYNQMLDFVYTDTRFYNRNPGGKLDVIENAPREVIKSFYDDWYKPNLAAVVVIGNVDVKVVKDEILKRFRLKDEYKKFPSYDFPIEPPGQFIVKHFPINDPHATSMGSITFREKVYPDKKNNFLKNSIDNLVITAFNNRLGNVVKQSDYLKSVFYNKSHRSKSGVLKAISFQPRQGVFFPAFQELVNEIEKLRRWGITQDEFETIISRSINSYKSSKRNNNDWFDLILENFIYHEPITDEDKILDMWRKLRKDNLITVQDINAGLKKIGLTSGIRLATLSSSNQNLPSKSEFRNYYLNASSLKLKNEQPQKQIVSLINKEKNSKIKEGNLVRHNLGSKGYLLELGNKVKVYYKPIETNKKKIAITGIGRNSDSLKYTQNIKDLFSFHQATKAFSWTKIGGYDYHQTDIFFNTLSIEVNYFLNSYFKGISINLPIDKLEEGFQALYLIFNDLSFDSKAVGSFSNRVLDDINRMRENILSNLSYYRKELLFPNSAFRLQWDDYDMKNFDPQLSYDIMKKSLHNITDFTFYVTGNVEVNKLIPLLKKYLASIIDTAPKDSPNFVTSGITLKKETLKTYKKGKGQSLVMYGWGNEWDRKPSLKERVLASLAESALNIKLFQEIREKESGVYTIYAFLGMDIYSKLIMDLQISFSTKPDRIQELIQKSQKIIYQLSEGNIDSEVMEFARKTLRTSYKELKNNSLNGYTRMMFKLNQYGENPVEGHQSYLDMLSKVSNQEVFKYLKSHLLNGRYYEVIQNPLNSNP